MTETERKALALVNEANFAQGYAPYSTFSRTYDTTTEALCRAIEQHEAFRQEVSDAVAGVIEELRPTKVALLSRFIITKPDPLVEVMLRAWPLYADRMDDCSSDAEALRAAIEKHGGKIVWEGQTND
jgi:hypothetical protein